MEPKVIIDNRLCPDFTHVTPYMGKNEVLKLEILAQNKTGLGEVLGNLLFSYHSIDGRINYKKQNGHQAIINEVINPQHPIVYVDNLVQKFQLQNDKEQIYDIYPRMNQLKINDKLLIWRLM